MPGATPHIKSDKRGRLIELFRGKFAQCNLLLMRKGSLWGKHYHQKTREYFYVLEGKISVSFVFLKTKKRREKLFKTGESFIIEPYTLHTISVLKSSQCLVLYSRQFNKKHPDLYQEK